MALKTNNQATNGIRNLEPKPVAVLPTGLKDAHPTRLETQIQAWECKGEPISGINLPQHLNRNLKLNTQVVLLDLHLLQGE